MKIIDLKVPGTIFSSPISTSEIELKNYGEVTFLIESGEGTEGITTVIVQGRSGTDGEYTNVAFLFAEKNGEFTEVEESGKAITIGGTSGAVKFYRVKVTDMLLASKEVDRIKLNLTAVDGSTVVGAIYAILDKPRYSE
ncbi:hypothetical protein [Caloramator proteoclasticus]|uniref:Uncharacterized protein n=1 Tax=Caloramator proteoclasticus DSM 10124 TaxID=1121262 RepID=A0A1M5C751_9CLOT|nr:hypothetical protein [Caloramator proteoclasticus]SHF50437.1 hypothetical protein SAMN02746091_02663 [Caloramator proteoclasticus DSM 10124]